MGNTMTRARNGATQKFLMMAVVYRGDDCLIWPFHRDHGGYAHINVVVDGRRTIRRPSRLVCEAVNGPPPTFLHQAAHSCGTGNKGCIAPRHLRWATRVENEADKLLHGTRARGEINGHAKLTSEKVYQIRTLLDEGLSQRAIAKEFGVDPSNISHIRRGKNWRWLNVEQSA